MSVLICQHRCAASTNGAKEADVHTGAKDVLDIPRGTLLCHLSSPSLKCRVKWSFVIRGGTLEACWPIYISFDNRRDRGYSECAYKLIDCPPVLKSVCFLACLVDKVGKRDCSLL